MLLGLSNQGKRDGMSDFLCRGTARARCDGHYEDGDGSIEFADRSEDRGNPEFGLGPELATSNVYFRKSMPFVDPDTHDSPSVASQRAVHSSRERISRY